MRYRVLLRLLHDLNLIGLLKIVNFFFLSSYSSVLDSLLLLSPLGSVLPPLLLTSLMR